ncbi:MAG: S-layer homology domain-containing protein, partial [Oscillospiraceae bacterium]|nr:S-layer homology domain-containing protein [Oscillospiraceae bacterium]
TLVTAPHGGTPGAWKCSCSVCSVKNKTVSIPDTASAAGGAKTNNAGNQTYKTYGKTVNSYLVPCENGSFLRVEALQNAVAVESYDETGSFLWHRDLPMELPLFGGFYAGEDYFFLVFGQYNLRERDDVEVLRVVRYTKDLMRCGEVSVYGANTQIPFSSGSLRMLQQSDTLYIHTCHTMYQNSDGYIDDTNHQANMVLSVNVPSMTLNECFSRISGTHYGYVSHSFNQFIVSDGAYIYTLNQCDSDPRGALISRYHAKAGEGMFHLPVYSSMPYVNAFPFARQDGANYNITGATLGGMTICGENILAAGTSSREAAVSANDQQNVFVTVTDKTVFNKPYEEISDNGCLLGNHTRTVWLTAFASDAGVSVSTPQMTKLSDSRVLVLWNENGTLCWTILDELGSRVTEIFRDEDAGLSDCAPVCKGSTVEWYVTEGGAPVFYLLDANHPENLIKLPQTSEPVQQIRFTDVPEGAWFYDAVLWAVEKGITSGTSETTFSPFEACTRAQAVTFLWRAAGSPAPKGTTCPFTDVKPGAYYYKAVLWAVENGITSGVAADTFGSDLPCTREQIVTFLWKAAGGPAPSVSACPFADVIPGAYYYDAVLWAYGNGITSGMAADTFGTGSACNRAAIVLFLRCACG